MLKKLYQVIDILTNMRKMNSINLDKDFFLIFIFSDGAYTLTNFSVLIRISRGKYNKTHASTNYSLVSRLTRKTGR